MRILGISGSLRRGSHNRKLLRAAEELLPPGVELELWDELKAVPPFDEDDEAGPEPAAVASLRDAVAAADAILIATPEYNASVPGQLKNAIDWLSRPVATTPLRGKPALGFYPHVEEETRRRAQAAGFDVVVPRSRMAREAHQLVDSLLTSR